MKFIDSFRKMFKVKLEYVLFLFKLNKVRT